MVTAWSNSAVGTFVSLCVALAIINAGIVMVIQNSRVLFASARDKAWPEPVNNVFAKLGRFGSPWVATLAVGVPGAVLCFVNLDTLYGVTGVSVTGMYLLVAVAALFSRRGTHQHTPAWRMPLWPAMPVLLIAVLAYILSQQETSYLLWTGGITAWPPCTGPSTSARAGTRGGWCRSRRTHSPDRPAGVSGVAGLYRLRLRRVGATSHNEPAPGESQDGPRP